MASDVLKEEKSPSLIRTVALVAGAHIVMILSDGATLSFGIFLTDFADELNVGLGVIGAALSLLTSVQHTFSPVGAYIASKIGYRKTIVLGALMIAVGFMLSSQVQEAWQLFLSHSLFTACGVSLMYTNIISFVGLACDKHISIVNGVTLAGTAVGWIILPLFINVLREIYGWRGSLLLLGGVVLHATMLSLILFRNPPTTEHTETKVEYSKADLNEINGDDRKCIDERCNDFADMEEHNKDIHRKKTKAELLKEYSYLPVQYPLFGFLIIVANLTFLAFAGTLYHLVSSAIKVGIPEEKAALLLTIFGIGNIITRLLHGVPIKLKLIATNNLFAIALMVAGFSTFVLPFCKTYLGLALVTFFIGLSVGTCIPVIFLSTREIVGIENFPKAVGMLLLTTGFAGVTAGFFTGWIYDYFGSYNIAFFIMGSFFFISCFFIVIPRVCLKYKKDSANNDVMVTSEMISLSSPDTSGSMS